MCYLCIEKGGDPNGVCKNNLYPPLVLAGHHGYYKVIKVQAVQKIINHVLVMLIVSFYFLLTCPEVESEKI